MAGVLSPVCPLLKSNIPSRRMAATSSYGTACGVVRIRPSVKRWSRNSWPLGERKDALNNGAIWRPG